MRPRDRRADHRILRRLPGVVMLAALCAGLGVSASASAASPLSAPSHATLAQQHAAQAFVKDAIAFEREGHVKQAVDRLRRATQLDDTIATRLRLAGALEEDGRLRAARDCYLFASTMLPSTAAERQGVETAQAHAESLEAEMPRVSFVGALPEDATVTLDGLPVDVSNGRTVEIDPGEHVVVVDAPTRSLWRTKFQVLRGDAREIGVQAGAGFGPLADPSPRPLALDAGRLPLADRSKVVGDGAALSPPSERLGLAVDRNSTKTDAQKSTDTDSLATKPERVSLRDCTLMPCPERRAPSEIQNDQPHEERVDKRIFSSLTGGGAVGVTTTQGYLVFTAPMLMPNARLGASMMPNGSSYVGLSGLW